MIKINCMNYRDYIICFLGLVGTCEKSFLFHNFQEMTNSNSEWYARKVVNKLTEDNIIKETKTVTGKKIIRLTTEGYKLISQIPPLKYNYDLLTGNNKLKATVKDSITRNIQLGEIIAMFNKHGCLTNRLSVSYIPKNEFRTLWIEKYHKDLSAYSDLEETEKEYNPKPGKPTRCILENTIIECDTEEDIENDSVEPNIDKNHINFIPSIALKKNKNARELFNSSIAKGCVIGNGLLYGVYYLEGKIQRFSDYREKLFAQYLLTVYANIFGNESVVKLKSNFNSKGSTIIFRKATPESIDELLGGEYLDKENLLTLVYSHTYVIPLHDKRIARFLNPNICKEVRTEVYGKDESKRKAYMKESNMVIDGIIKDINEARDGYEDYPSFELYTMDLNKLVQIGETLMHQPVRVLCNQDEEKAIRKYLYSDVEYRFLNAAEIYSEEEIRIKTKDTLNRCIISNDYWR